MEIWQLSANVATTIGAGLAGLSAVIALVTYRTQVETAAEAHVHQLFRELFNANLLDEQVRRSYRMNTLRLYTVEEVFDWVREQERALDAWGWLRPFSARARRVELGQWRDTVASHLNAAMRERVEQHPECYGAAFIKFVLERAPRPEDGVDPTGPEGGE